MRRGLRFRESFDGDTTFAAMFVCNWAVITTSVAMMITAGVAMRVTSTTGSRSLRRK
jgi:hypothetical protein